MFTRYTEIQQMRYTHAILPRIPNSLKTEKKVNIDVELMQKQLGDLHQTMKESGVKVLEIDIPEGSQPQDLHVDDAVVIINGTALICRPKNTGVDVAQIAKMLTSLSWNVVECDGLINSKPVVLMGSDVIFTGKEIFVGIRKRGTNTEGAIVLGGVFCDYPTIPIHLPDKALPLKYYVSVVGPNILAVGASKTAQEILRKMEQEATFMYQIITVDDEEAVAALCVNGRTVFRSDTGATNFANLQKAGMQLWALDMSEVVKSGSPFTNYCLLLRELKLNHHP